MDRLAKAEMLQERKETREDMETLALHRYASSPMPARRVGGHPDLEYYDNIPPPHQAFMRRIGWGFSQPDLIGGGNDESRKKVRRRAAEAVC